MAPPWLGPFSVQTAATIAACRSAQVATATRAANVEALNSWSACSVSVTSMTRATSGVGASPSSSVRNQAAWESAGTLADTGSRPVRMRCQAATVAGTSVVSRIALRRFASASLARTSGSSAAASDTAVRRASSGWHSPGCVRSSASTGAGSARAARSRARNSPACAADGSSPNHSSQTTSSNGTTPARSPIS